MLEQCFGKKNSGWTSKSIYCWPLLYFSLSQMKVSAEFYQFLTPPFAVSGFWQEWLLLRKTRRASRCMNQRYWPCLQIAGYRWRCWRYAIFRLRLCLTGFPIIEQNKLKRKRTCRSRAMLIRCQFILWLCYDLCLLLSLYHWIKGLLSQILYLGIFV